MVAPGRRTGLAGAIGVIALLLCGSHGGRAGPPTVEVRDAWAQVQQDGQMAAVFMTLVSHGGSDRMMRAESPLARMVEMHEVATDARGWVMRPAAAPILPAETPVVLGPDGPHLMMLHLPRDMADGQRIPLTLTFEQAGAVRVEVPVKRVDAHEMPAGIPPRPNRGG